MRTWKGLPGILVGKEVFFLINIRRVDLAGTRIRVPKMAFSIVCLFGTAHEN